MGGAVMIGFLPFPGIWQAYCPCGHEACYRSEADARMADAMHREACPRFRMEEEGGEA